MRDLGVGFQEASASCSSSGSSRTTEGCFCKMPAARGELGLSLEDVRAGLRGGGVGSVFTAITGFFFFGAVSESEPMSPVLVVRLAVRLAGCGAGTIDLVFGSYVPGFGPGGCGITGDGGSAG